MISNDFFGALSSLREVEERVSEEKRKEVQDLIKYLFLNSWGLPDYREKLSQERKGGMGILGTAEGNIDKILANRFKKRGMSWFKRGANSLAKVIAMAENGELGNWIFRQYGEESTPLSITKRVKDRLRKEVKGLGENILASLPALSHPNSGRPWVQVLREIASLKIDPNLN